ncbi:hypothetical protein C8R45DRAFT_971936 [Mycena sanguinolenta]|nr:hypothetical protein C8R45DRAFT_971936 [Mycena sanguinolenta]
MLLATLLALATVHAAVAEDQGLKANTAPDYETEVENVLNRLQLRQINAGTTGDWEANPFAIVPVGWFLENGGLTRNGWRLGDVPDPNSSEIIYSLNTTMPEPYVAAIVQNPNQPENGLPVSTTYYSTVHATYPTSSSSETSTEVVNRDMKHNKRDSLDLFMRFSLAIMFDGPFEAIPWVDHFFTVFSDGCPSFSTLTTTTTDTTGNTTTWTDTLSTDFVQIQHDFPSDIVLPFTFNQTTKPFVGSISGVVRESPFQIALATGSDAPSLYSYYQIVSGFCGTQEND